MASARIERLRRLGHAVGPWMSIAFWLSILAGAVAGAQGAKWNYVILTIVVSYISVWVISQIARLYRHDFLGWLLQKFDKLD